MIVIPVMRIKVILITICEDNLVEMRLIIEPKPVTRHYNRLDLWSHRGEGPGHCLSYQHSMWTQP